jgi:hypothetical protein
MIKQYKFRFTGFILLAALVFSNSDEIMAQEISDHSDKPEEEVVYGAALKSEHNLRLGIKATYAPATFTFIGKIKRSDFFGLALQFWHSKFQLGNFEVDLGSEILAAGRIKFPENGIDGPKDKQYGIGINPAVVQTPLFNNFFVSGTGGFIVFPETFPDAFGTKLNFVFDFGLGYEIDVSPSNQVQFGYQIQHISNGGTGRINPGIDFHMFYIGYRF